VACFTCIRHETDSPLISIDLVLGEL
jgi:hypothetical protein